MAYGLELTIRLLAGSEIKIAASEAFKQGNLFLLFCHLAFWYLFATDRMGRGGERKRDIVTLNLNENEN